MIQWGVVAAYIVPLVAAIAGASGWFSWVSRKREDRIRGLIDNALNGLKASQDLLAQRVAQVETALDGQAKHLDRQDAVLSAALQAIARIEGRLAGPLTLASQT